MHMLFPSLRYALALSAALLVALAASGCAFKNPFASKNPLIDDEPAPKAPAKIEAAPAKKEAAPAEAALVKKETVAAASEAAPVKPVLPKPALVVKPAEDAKPAPATQPAAPKPDAPKPTPEIKAAAPSASAEAAKPASAAASTAIPPNVTATGTGTANPAVASTPALQPTIATISDPGRPAPTGWDRWLGIFKPYKINIQQGNFVSHDMAAKVRVGMTKEQVRFVLGTPLLTDMFHANRWDYLFRLQKPNGELTANRMAIFFRDNRIERIESSELPSESEYLTHIAGPAEQPAKPAAATTAKPAAPTPEPSTKP